MWVLDLSMAPPSCLYSLKVARWLGYGVRFSELGAVVFHLIVILKQFNGGYGGTLAPLLCDFRSVQKTVCLAKSFLAKPEKWEND